MSSSSSSNTKSLHPIYVALESHQYSRAIKLCLAQPSTNLLAQALLAHAYAKSDQRHKSCLVLSRVLSQLVVIGAASTDSSSSVAFPELSLEIKYSLDRRQLEAATSSQQQQQPAASKSGGGGGKKGKKKPASKGASKAAATPSAAASTGAVPNYTDWDWIDQLDTSPLLPENWDEAVPAGSSPGGGGGDDDIFSMTTLLGTMSMTLTHLRLYLTAYQVYAWAVQKATTTTGPSTPEQVQNLISLLQQAYALGLTVWLAPRYEGQPNNNLAPRLLSQLQGMALQLSRLQQSQDPSISTAWAAQTALWQCELHRENSSNSSSSKQEDARIAFLPRLAESLALKSMQQQADADTSMENFLFYLKTLEFQEKWSDQLAALEEKISSSASSKDAMNSTDVMTGGRPMLLEEEQARTLQELKRYEEARNILKDLLQEQPDRWDYWQRFIACCEDNDDEILVTETEALIQKVCGGDDADTISSHYPLRGPYLARLHVLGLRYQRASSTAVLADLVQQIIDYGDRFASRMSCTYDDLSPSLDIILQNSTRDDATVQQLLTWLGKLRATPPSGEDDKERARQLRSYLFAVKMTYQIVAHYKSKELEQSCMPTLTDLLRVWKDFEVRERSANQAQKESRPSDELVLLAVQQLLRVDDNKVTKDSTKLTLAAAILEAAIRHSPYNAYLKLEAIFVYADLNATQRSFDLFRQLYIKHIQHESMTYIILPMLRSGGLYQEVIGICQEILRLQTTAIRDASDFTGRAMEHGTLSKADEFVKFHRNKMNKSLMTLEAKGLLLDCAPTYKHDEKQIDVGAVHGLVGEKDDLDRLCPMVMEAHNPYATFSLLRLQGSVADNLPNFVDNRDLTLMSHDIILERDFCSSEEILSDSIRRGHHHSLLMRACLCVDAAKGPKKGKVVKPSADSSKRCLSLMSTVNAAENFCETDPFQSAGYKRYLLAMLALCRAIVVVSGGRVDTESKEADSLEFREKHGVIQLEHACKQVQEGKDQLRLADGQQVAETSRSLPDCLVPTFALFQMCAKLLEIFGWGKRKRKTRPCAAALADLSIALTGITDDMLTCLASLPTKRDSPLTDLGGDINILDFIDAQTLSETYDTILRSQQFTRDRIESIVLYIKEVLSSFDLEE